ncbi:MAG: chemotaxis protein CheB, partial [Thioalkalispiraceae bacterium]
MTLQDPPVAPKSWPSTQDEFRNVRIAIVSYSLKHRQHLQKVMEHTGLRVVINEPGSIRLLDKLDIFEADVILLDIDENSDQQQEFLTALLDKTSTPIIFDDITVLSLYEPATMGKWYSKLLSKIANATGKLEWEELDLDLGCSNIVETLSSQSGQSLHQDLATNVWLLGASLGGPDAVKRFLAELPVDLPVAFVLAQHLGENFVSRLAEQLNKVTALKVINAHTGHVLRHGEVLIVPIDHRLMINPIGAVELLPLSEKTAYSPSINLVMQDFAQRYRQQVNAIIFSGMCDDGVFGAQQVAEQGGEVWVQSPDTCVVS